MSDPKNGILKSLIDGGLDGLQQVEFGEADLAIDAPALMVGMAPAGQVLFQRPLPHLRALAVLPQNDRMVSAIDPKFNIRTFDDLRREKPALKLATSVNDGTNFIGYVAEEYMKAYGILQADIDSWGGEMLFTTRPEQSSALVESDEADVLLQEAIMARWWEVPIETKKLVPLEAEFSALIIKEKSLGR